MKIFLLLCLCGATAFAQQAPAPAAVEGVRGVRQEGSGKVKEVDPAAKNVAPTTVDGVEKVDGVKTPGGAKPVKHRAHWFASPAALAACVAADP